MSFLHPQIMNTTASNSDRWPLLRVIFITVCLVMTTGCSTFYKPNNQAVTRIDNDSGYRLPKARGGNAGDTFVLMAFSGGGTRAAALSYGVLQELRDTIVDSRNHQRVRLLDEVDSISSVSGGSFTAAYFGLFGDKLFTDYERVFLKRSIQGALIQKLFDPTYWWRSLFTGFDRTEMAIEYYDNNIFEGKTFKDINLASGPYIEINATDLGGGNRFAFIQAYFDVICSDLQNFNIARAVTASSAVPIAFPPVVLKNHTGTCNPKDSLFVQYLNAINSDDPRIAELKTRIMSYQDAEKHPYIHLIDGGVSDNLGIRALTDRIEGMRSGASLSVMKRIPDKILIISVDAEVVPEHTIDESASKPSIAETIDAFSDAQFRLYGQETRALLDIKLKEMVEELKKAGHNPTVYTANVSFSSVQGNSLKTYLNQLPTTLELSDHDVDMLAQVGRELLRGNPEFRGFLRATNGQRVNVQASQPVTRLENSSQ